MAEHPATGGPHTQHDLADLLRTCVSCGLCLPHCATWLATGHEAQSPRGRLLLLGDTLGQSPALEADPAYLQAFDQCIGCRACEAACPSGVPFSLLERGQELARNAAVLPPGTMPEPVVPNWVVRRLDSRNFLRLVGLVSNVAIGLIRAVLGRRWRRRLASMGDIGRRGGRLLGSLPRSPEADHRLVARLDGLVGRQSTWRRPQPRGEGASEVLFFEGCANAGLLPGSSRRLQELLAAAGCSVVRPAGQQCCGALAGHTGRPGRQALLRRTNQKVMAGKAPIVVEAAGCGLELQSSPGTIGSRVVDATVLLSRLTLPPLATLDLKVVVHDPCHARHGQGILAEPRALLGRIPGVLVLEPAEAEVCCGAGGAWGLRYPDLSADLGRRKARLLAETGADVIVTANPGCLGQIADGLLVEGANLPILPLSDLLWYAAALAAEPA